MADEETELAKTVIMLFDSAIEQGQTVAMRPNALLMAPPVEMVEDAAESREHKRFIHSIKMRSILRAFRNEEDTAERTIEAMAEDVALWALVGGYVWARDHDIRPLTSIALKSQPMETGLDKWSAAECQQMGQATSTAIQSKFGHGPTAVAAIAPFAAWNTGKKLFQFEKDGEVLAALLKDGDGNA